MKNLIFIFIFGYGGMVQASLEEAKMKYETSRDNTQKLGNNFKYCLKDVRTHRKSFDSRVVRWEEALKKNQTIRSESAMRSATRAITALELKESECVKIINEWDDSKLTEMTLRTEYISGIFGKSVELEKQTGEKEGEKKLTDNNPPQAGSLGVKERYEVARNEIEEADDQLIKCHYQMDRIRNLLDSSVAEWSSAKKSGSEQSVTEALTALQKAVVGAQKVDNSCMKVVRNWIQIKKDEMTARGRYYLELKN